MHVSTLTTTDDRLLLGVREVLADSDEALLCVAFVSREGVHLLSDTLGALGDRAKLLVTTTFGTTRPEALDEASRMGVQVGVLNPGGPRTYHPKLYVGRRGTGLQAVVGSANLTGGLVGNVEVATRLDGNRGDDALREVWAWGEGLWRRKDVQPWTPGAAGPVDGSTFEPDLHRLLRAQLGEPMVREAVVYTLGRSPRPNRIVRLTPTGLYVETGRTRERATGPQLIPAWMLNVAWTYLRAHGRLRNSHLLNVLHVHRSSAVCAVLATLPGVRVTPGRDIALEWLGA